MQLFPKWLDILPIWRLLLMAHFTKRCVDAWDEQSGAELLHVYQCKVGLCPNLLVGGETYNYFLSGLIFRQGRNCYVCLILLKVVKTLKWSKATALAFEDVGTTCRTSLTIFMCVHLYYIFHLPLDLSHIVTTQLLPHAIIKFTRLIFLITIHPANYAG